MKTPYSARRRRGFALLLVLIILSFAAAVAILFLLSTRQERSSTSSYAQGSRVRQLASESVNLVMGQINAATKEETSVSANQISWASQPGMIRTYKTDGTLSNAYKLYSWSNLTEGATYGTASGGPFNPNDASELPPANWSSLPAQYTDLNAPVNDVYPIVDPTVANSTSGGVTQQSSGAPPWDFPGEFSIVTDNTAYHPSATNTLPMPVQWLYILRDGTWASPTSGGPTTVTVSAATAANPIVGRIAFWTDDETSKVDVNTASEGSFWDTPKAGTMDEMQFAGNPPTQGEFNRVSGHPATTSLSAVFPEMRTGSYSRWASGGNAPNSQYLLQMQAILGLTPRIAWGGSEGGTFPIGVATGTGYNQTYAPPAFSFVNSAISLDSDRLYATAADAWFQPLLNGSSRASNTVFDDAGIGTNLTAQQLSQRLFFLTANSRAPETTLYGTPRVSLWPVTWPYATPSFSATTGVTGITARPEPLGTVAPSTNLATDKFMAPQERLLAFCSTLDQGSTTAASAPLAYYFQRQDPDSPTYDWNLQVSGDPRNQDMVNYLRTEMGWTPPGMGGGLSLATKWGANNADWTALNCFDFSRSQINQYTYNSGTQTKDASGSKTSNYLYTYTGLQTSNASGVAPVVNGISNPAEPNAYTVVPLHVTMNSGNTYTTEGAFPALKEATLVFYATNRMVPTEISPPNYSLPSDWANLITWNGVTGASQTTQMQAVMLLGFSQMDPGVTSYRGQTYYSPSFWVRLSGPSFSVNSTPINFPSPAGTSVQYGTLHTFQSFLSSMTASLYQPSGAPKFFTNGTNGAPGPTNYTNWSFVSVPITVAANLTQFAFTGTQIQVDVYAPSGSLTNDTTTTASQLVSSQQIDFSKWNGSLPIPVAPRWNILQAPSTTVPMPPYNAAGTAASNTVGWQTEIVPTINLLGSQTLPNPPDPRTTAAGYANNPGATGNPLIYAYTDASGAYTSMNFQDRLYAILNKNSYTAEGGAGTALFSFSQPHTPVQAYQLITPYDTAISMVSDPTASTLGDPRVTGRGLYNSLGSTFSRIDTVMNTVSPGSTPLSVVDYTGVVRTTDKWQYHDLSSTPGVRFPTGYWLDYEFGPAGTPSPELAIEGSYTQTSAVGGPGGYLLGRTGGDAVVGLDSNVSQRIDPNWDWTAMPGNFPDGGLILRPDQDYQILTMGGVGGAMTVPYFRDAAPEAGAALSENVFIPNRQIPSPVILGTLPSDMNTGWQTLNFCPDPAKQMNGGSHPGVGTLSTPSATGADYTALPDHLLLDLFWMPVAEPYPISEQFSTAGKVNLNYAMMPFPYIDRKTGLDAVLKSVFLTAMPNLAGTAANFGKYYKSYGGLYVNGRLDELHTRYPIDVAETLKAFDYKFSSGDIFRSASQICDMFLYPDKSPDNPTQSTPTALVTGSTTGSNSAITGWWKTQQFTSDNEREDPYNAIYSRVTTKSNTYTVHWRVQALHKATLNGYDPNPTVWTEGKDQVASELRGSTLIERYIDPNATNIPDYATNTSAQPLSYYYKWRVDTETYFQPPP